MAEKLVEHLMRCAVCGAVPKISDTARIDPDPDPEHCYKLFCSKCGVHNSCGNWFENKYKACLDWNRRQIENEDGEKPIKNLGEKLKPCPFCGGKANLEDTSRFIVAKCGSCGAESGMVKVSAEYCANDKATESWNRRKDNG